MSLLHIYSSADGYLGHFPVLATVNNTAVNICVHIIYKHVFSSLGMSLAVEWLSRIITMGLIFETTLVVLCPQFWYFVTAALGSEYTPLCVRPPASSSCTFCEIIKSFCSLTAHNASCLFHASVQG